MNTVDVVAVQLGRFYILYINRHEVGVVADLGHAKRLVRGYLDLIEPRIDHDSWGVRVSVENAFEDLYDSLNGG